MAATPKPLPYLPTEILTEIYEHIENVHTRTTWNGILPIHRHGVYQWPPSTASRNFRLVCRQWYAASDAIFQQKYYSHRAGHAASLYKTFGSPGSEKQRYLADRTVSVKISIYPYPSVTFLPTDSTFQRFARRFFTMGEKDLTPSWNSTRKILCGFPKLESVIISVGQTHFWAKDDKLILLLEMFQSAMIHETLKWPLSYLEATILGFLEALKMKEAIVLDLRMPKVFLDLALPTLTNADFVSSREKVRELVLSLFSKTDNDWKNSIENLLEAFPKVNRVTFFKMPSFVSGIPEMAQRYGFLGNIRFSHNVTEITLIHVVMYRNTLEQLLGEVGEDVTIRILGTCHLFDEKIPEPPDPVAIPKSFVNDDHPEDDSQEQDPMDRTEQLTESAVDAYNPDSLDSAALVLPDIWQIVFQNADRQRIWKKITIILSPYTKLWNAGKGFQYQSQMGEVQSWKNFRNFTVDIERKSPIPRDMMDGIRGDDEEEMKDTPVLTTIEGLDV